MVRVLVSGYIGFSNFGDDAILSVLADYLKRTGNHVSALSSNPELTEEVFDIEAYPYMNFFKIIKALKMSDILISGGGSLLQNKTSNRSLIYYLAIILLAKIMGLKIVIFAQGIGPIKGDFFQAVTKYVLSLCDIVTVRNSFSERLLKRWGIKSKLVCDPVWNIYTPPYQPQGIIGVQLRPSENMEPNFVKNLAKHIGAYYFDKKIKIFPFQQDLDTGICNQFRVLLKKEYPNIDMEIIPYGSIEEIKEDFSQLEALFAMRFHAVLLGLRFGVKTLPMSYDEKVVNLAQDFKIKYIEVSDCVDFYEVIRDFKENYQESDVFEQMRKMRFDWEYFTQAFGAVKDGVDI